MKRKEEKIRQAELKRIQEIKDKVQAKIFSKNELRQTLNALTISDIDNYERQFLFGTRFSKIKIKSLMIFSGNVRWVCR